MHYCITLVSYFTNSFFFYYNKIFKFQKISGTALHKFPNPDKFPERFKVWVDFVEGKDKRDTSSDCEIYKKKRLCDNHFLYEYKNRYKRLNALAIPSIELPGKFRVYGTIYFSLNKNSDIFNKYIVYYKIELFT